MGFLLFVDPALVMFLSAFGVENSHQLEDIDEHYLVFAIDAISGNVNASQLY